MKNLYAFFLLFITNSLFSQNEQLSLNFFAKELLPKIENCKVYFDGKVNQNESYDESVIKNIVSDYYYCKYDGRLANNNNFKINTFDLKKIENSANIEKSIDTKLTTPKNIKFKKELNYKKRPSGKLLVKINKIFTPKYFLEISPSIEIDNDYYLTLIHLNKIDLSAGIVYYIVTKNDEVIDWCESGWEL